METMAGNELAQLLSGPLQDDWLGASDFDCLEQSLLPLSPIIEGGGLLCFRCPVVQGMHGACIQRECPAVVPGSTPAHDMPQQTTSCSTTTICCENGVRATSSSNGHQCALNVLGGVSSREAEPNYAQTKAVCPSGLMLPEPLGSKAKRFSMHMMGREVFSHYLNSGNCCPVIHQVKHHNGSHHSATTCGLTGPSVSFATSSQCSSHINAAIPQGSCENHMTACSGSQPHGQLDPIGQIPLIDNCQQGTVLPDHDVHELQPSPFRNRQMLHSTGSVPLMDTQGTLRPRGQEWHQRMLELPSSIRVSTSSGLSSSLPSTGWKETGSLRKCYSTPFLQSSAKTSCLSSSVTGGEVQMPKIAKLTKEERRFRIMRYKQKKSERNFDHRVTYQCRKTLADTRPRIRGRFAKISDKGAVLPQRDVPTSRKRKLNHVGERIVSPAKSAAVACHEIMQGHNHGEKTASS